VSIYQQNSSGTIKATEYPKERTEIKYARWAMFAVKDYSEMPYQNVDIYSDNC
jgi:hypothetical protein